MSGAVSPVTGKPDGLAAVCRAWCAPREEPRRHPGPVGPMPDAALLNAIRLVLADSPFPGEGHRKLWAKLRVRDARTSKRRVLRLMRQNTLLAPSRVGLPRGPRSHDGSIIPDTVDTMWGTDLTTPITGEGQATEFIAVDHFTAECVGIHADRHATRFPALEPIGQGVRQHFGGFAKDVARGLSVRHDHGSHVWTARGVQEGGTEIRRRYDCGHVSGLLTRHHGRWPRWVPRMTSEQYIGMELPATRTGFSSFVGSTDRHPLQTRLIPWHQCDAQAALG
jgi:hypothetical protein